MKKIIFLLSIVFFFISCNQHVDTSYYTSGADLRFSVVYQQYSISCCSQIVLDNVTGKKYFFYKFGNAGGLVELND